MLLDSVFYLNLYRELEVQDLSSFYHFLRFRYIHFPDWYKSQSMLGCYQVFLDVPILESTQKWMQLGWWRFLYPVDVGGSVS